MINITQTKRVCANCGTPEVRTKDRRGVESTNYYVLTGTCVDCLSGLAREGRKQPDPVVVPFDARAAQARNDA